MTSPKIVQLVTDLHQKTINKAVAWEVAESDGSLKVSFSKSSVVLAKNTGKGEPDFALTFFNAEGKALEKISVKDAALTNAIGSSQAYFIMKDLYERAQRIATGLDKSIGDIVSEL